MFIFRCIIIVIIIRFSFFLLLIIIVCLPVYPPLSLLQRLPAGWFTHRQPADSRPVSLSVRGRIGRRNVTSFIFWWSQNDVCSNLEISRALSPGKPLTMFMYGFYYHFNNLCFKHSQNTIYSSAAWLDFLLFQAKVWNAGRRTYC